MESILPNRLIQALTSSKPKHRSSIASVQPPPASNTSKSSQPVSTALRELPPHPACKMWRSGLSTHVNSHTGTHSTGTYTDPPGQGTAALAHGPLHAEPDAHLHREAVGPGLRYPAQTLKFFPLEKPHSPSPDTRLPSTSGLGPQPGRLLPTPLFLVKSQQCLLLEEDVPGCCLRPYPAHPDDPGQCNPEGTPPACSPPAQSGPSPQVSRAKSHQQLDG